MKYLNHHHYHYFRRYSFRLQFNRSRLSPSRPSIPVQRRMLPLISQELPYLGVAEARLVRPPIITTTRPLHDELTFIPPSLTEAAPQGIPIGAATGFAVGEVLPIVGQPVSPPSAAGISEIVPAPAPQSEIVPDCGAPQPTVIQRFDPHNESALPFISWMSEPEGPHGPPGGSNGSGGGLGGGGATGPQGRGPVVLFLIFFLWCCQRCLQKFRELLEEYKKIRERWSEEPVPPKDSSQYRKWLEKDRFYQLTDVLLGFVTLVITPKLFIPVLRSLSNAWSQAILSLLIPLTF